MHTEFYLNACVKLKSQGSSQNTYCEVGAKVKADFIVNFHLLYGEVLLQCVRELKTSKLRIISLKLMQDDEKLKITANVLLPRENNSPKDDSKEDNGQGCKKNPETKKDAEPDLITEPEEQEDEYLKVEFFDKTHKIKEVGIYRLFKYMEALSQKEKGNEFAALVHVRVVPVEHDDIHPDKF
ncbi:MAG: hypothetical protein NTZ49_06060 [Candidatus Parcubacteria bacterium]|nr:hypothetical protein [Candidatus Parcubacteria bacterium]